MSLFDNTENEVLAYVPGGMQGLQGLSADEREEFESSLTDIQKSYNDADKNAIYFNRQYINKYGLNAFKNTSYQDRMNQLTNESVDKDFEDRFSGYSNYDDLKTLSVTGKKRLLVSDYQDPLSKEVNINSWQPDFEQEDEEIQKQREEIARDVYSSGNAQLVAGYTITKKASDTLQDAVTGIKRWGKSVWLGIQQGHNDGILESAKAYADKDVLGTQEYVNNYQQIKNDIDTNITNGTIKQSDFDDAFEDFANSTYTTLDEEGKVTEVPIFAQYTARKDETTFGIKTDLYALEEPEKRAIYSKYLALQQTMIKPDMTDEEKAHAQGQIIDMINRDFETRADEKETFLSNSARTYKSIGTKCVSQFATEILGLYFLGLEDQEKANFLAGKDETGEDLPWYFNMKYWNNVDMYNAWTPEQHAKIERNAGISEDKTVTSADRQGDWMTTENFGEAVGMTGYIAQSVIQDLALRGAGKMVKGAILSEKLGKLGKLNRVIANNKIVQGVTDFSGKAFRANAAAFPETMMEGVSIYDQTYNEIMSNFSEKLQNDEVLNQKLTEELDTRFATSMQNATWGQSRVTDVEGNTIGFESQQNIPIYDITGQTDKPVAYATSEKEAYDMYQQMILSREKGDAEQAAREAATQAALTTMAGFQLKNAVIGALFEDFKFSKRLTPSGFDYRQLADGTFRMNKKFVPHMIGSVAKQMVGGFIDETTDSYVEQFGSAWGLNAANNYMNKKYNTKAFTDGLDEISNVYAAMNGLGGAVMDPEAYKEGFIGALAPANTHINPVGMVQYARMTAEQRAALNKLDKLNMFIYNPLLQTATNDYHDYKNVQEEVEHINKFINDHKGDFTDILGMLAAHERMYNSQTANEAETNKEDVAFEFISMMSKLRAKNAKQANAYMENLSRLAKGEITDEDIAQFFAYGDNQQLQQQKGSQANDIAREQIQQNAQGLIDKVEQYQKIENDFIKDFGDPYANPNLQDLHDQVTYMQLQSYSFKKRIKKLREKAGLNSEATDNGTSTFTEEQAQIISKPLEQRIQNIDDRLQRVKAQIAAKQFELKNAKNFKKKGWREEVKDLQSSIKNLELYSQHLQEKKKNINSELDQINKNTTNVGDFLNIEQIKALNDRTLAYLMEDEKIAAELKKRDPLYKEHIKDIAAMEEAVKNNEWSVKTIKENPQHFREEALKYKMEQLGNIVNDYKKRQLANDVIEYKKKGIESLRKMSSARIRQVADATSDAAVNKLADAVEVHEDAMAILKKKYSQNAESLNNWQKTLQTIIGNANSKEEAYQMLEDAANNAGFDQNLQNQLATLYKDLTGVEVTRRATTPTTPEGKTKNKQQKKQREAENKQKKESKEKKKQATRKKKEEEKQKPKKEEKKPEEEKSKEEKKPEESKEKEMTKEQLFDEDGNLIEGTTTLNLEEDTTTEDKPESVNSEEIEQEEIKNETNITPVIAGQTTQESEENKFKKQDNPTEMQGNAMYRYATGKNGQMIERTPGKKGGAFEALVSWCKANNIDYQNIIDNELSKFLTKKTPIHIMYANPNMDGATNMKNVPLLCVEFTDAIAKKMPAYAKGEKGGVFEFNGKKYLMIGNLGYASNQTEEGKAQAASYYNCRNLSLNKSTAHFKANPSDRVFVDTSYSTRMTKMNTGSLVRQIGEEAKTYRKISELLADVARNPRGLSWKTLNWAVSRLQTDDLIIGNVPDNQIYPLQQKAANNGNTFVLIQNANGMYVPVYIQPRFTQDEEFKNNDCELKKDIEAVIRNLSSQDYSTRLQAIKNLSQLLILSDSGLNILIGTEKVPTVSIVEGDQVKQKFNLNSRDFNAQQLVDYVMKQCNFRINVSAKALTDEYMLKKLDEAGALMTDIAYLGVMNASFTVAGVDAKGNMLTQEEQKPAPRVETNNRANSVMIKKKVYRKEGKIWVDDLGTPIMDQSLIDQCELNQQLDTMGEHPIYVQGNTEFHVIDAANNVVIRRNSQKECSYMSKEGAANIIKTLNQNIAETNATLQLEEEKQKVENKIMEEEKTAGVEVEDLLDSEDDEDTRFAVSLTNSDTPLTFTIWHNPKDSNVFSLDITNVNINEQYTEEQIKSLLEAMFKNLPERGVVIRLNGAITMKESNFYTTLSQFLNVVTTEQREIDGKLVELPIYSKKEKSNDQANIENNTQNQQQQQKKLNTGFENSKNSATFAFNDILEGLTEETVAAMCELSTIILEKSTTGQWADFPIDNPDAYEDYLKSKGILTSGITNLQNWLNEIKECK